MSYRNRFFFSLFITIFLFANCITLWSFLFSKNLAKINVEENLSQNISTITLIPIPQKKLQKNQTNSKLSQTIEENKSILRELDRSRNLSELEDPNQIENLNQSKQKQSDFYDSENEVQNRSSDKATSTYVKYLLSEIAKNKNYPESAKEKKIEGTVFLCVSVAADGSLASAKILKSSGYDILDSAAIRAVNDAAPFKKVVDKISTPLEVKFAMEFVLR